MSPEERSAMQRVMENPDLWPKSATPHLTVKNPKAMAEEGSQDTAFGMLVKKDGIYTLWVGHGAKRLPIEYIYVEDILEEGWVVD